MSISSTAIIHPEAIIGENVTIGHYSVIGKCTIGRDCIIHPHVVINDGVIIFHEVEIFSGAVIGKEPKGAGATARPIDFERVITIGAGTSICPHVVIYYDVEIGSNCLIGDGASIREKCSIGSRCIISRYVTINYNVDIGHKVKIMDLTHITGNTVIEDEVFISALVGTANDNVLSRQYNDDILGQYIQSGAFIGLGANLLPAVKVGYNAKVGAGALVTKDVPKNSLVKGIPAR